MFWACTVMFFIELLFWAGFCVLKCMNKVERSALERHLSEEKDHLNYAHKDKSMNKTNTTVMVAPSQQDLSQNQSMMMGYGQQNVTMVAVPPEQQLNNVSYMQQMQPQMQPVQYQQMPMQQQQFVDPAQQPLMPNNGNVNAGAGQV